MHIALRASMCKRFLDIVRHPPITVSNDQGTDAPCMERTNLACLGASVCDLLYVVMRVKASSISRICWACTAIPRDKNFPVQRAAQRAVRWNRSNRLLAGSFLADLSEALQDVVAKFRRGQSDPGSSPCSRPRQSHGQTSPGSPHIHRLQPGRGAGSLNRRPDRHAYRST